MVRIINERIIEGNKKYIEAFGVEDDTKPTADIVTGSSFTEVDTGTTFLFDEVSGDWVAQGGDSGGGSLPDSTPANVA